MPAYLKRIEAVIVSVPPKLLFLSAYILAQYNMEVIDCGVALHNMHAPWEVASKVDIYETMKGYRAFLIEA